MGKLKKHADLEKLFDTQIATFKDRGVLEQIIGALRNQKSAVVQKASKMTIGEGNLPFMPVIKPVYLGYYGLMSLVRNGSNEGYTNLNPAAITDEVETPNGLYYVYDVENGNSTRDKSPEAAEKIFKQQKRSPLTVVEVINLCILTDVLSKHDVWAAGSSYGSADEVPIVHIVNNEVRPELFCFFGICAHPHWGSASCDSR